MKTILVSLLLAMVWVFPATAQSSLGDDPSLGDPLLDDADLNDPQIDDSILDLPADDPSFRDPAVTDPGTRVEDLPRYRRVPTNRKLTTEEIFAMLDTDGNGVIDASEWRQQSMTIFFVRDANEDTQLSRAELPGISDEAFNKADLNGDGILSGYEFNQSELNSFATADADKDGQVTMEEFRIFLEHVAQ